MRIIKFRSWHDGEMYDVDDLRFNVKGVSYAHLIQPSGRILYHTPDMGKIELMQFTGLLDTHGKEIYEGDIVRWEGIGKVFIRPVVWAVDDAMFLPNQMKGEVKVIGNIYENPELLSR